MTPHEFADRLEHFAKRVRSIRGVDRVNPHVFVEDKSEIIGELMAEAKAARMQPKPVAGLPPIRPGIRTIGRREIRVETRRRA